MKRATLRRLALIPAFVLASGAAFAQSAGTIDTTAATGAVTAAQTAVLAVLAAMITMMGAIWATRKILRLFGR